MRTVIAALCGALALTAVAPPALAQAPADKNDLRCILVLSLASRDPKNLEPAKQATFYYWGRLASRGPTTRITPAQMVAEAKSMSSAEQVQAELTRCGNEVNASSQQLSTVMKGFQEAAQAARPATPQGATAGAPAPKAPPTKAPTPK